MVLKVIILFLFSFKLTALELQTSAGLSQLEDLNYHYVSYKTTIGFSLSKQNDLSLFFGSTLPNNSHGYSQIMQRAGIVYNLKLNFTEHISTFWGIGLGAYYDRISYGEESAKSTIPSLVLQSGIKIGFNNFGFVLAIDDFIGIYNPAHLPYIIWPHYSYTLGVYFAL